jgi:hypothetical protein
VLCCILARVCVFLIPASVRENWFLDTVLQYDAHFSSFVTFIKNWVLRIIVLRPFFIPTKYLKMAPKTSPYMTLHPSTSTLSLASHHHHSDDIEDNDSETTLANEGFLSKRSNLASKSSRLQNILTWIRWGTIVFLQGIIIILLLPTSGIMDSGWGLGLIGGGGKVKGDGIVQAGVVPVDKSIGGKWNAGKTETGGDVNGLYVPCECPTNIPSCFAHDRSSGILRYQARVESQTLIVADDIASHKYTLLAPEELKFVPNMSTDANRMEIRRNWDMLMPRTSSLIYMMVTGYPINK